MTFLRIPGAVEAKAVFDGLDVEVEDDHAVNIADAELVWERNLGFRFWRALLEENE